MLFLLGFAYLMAEKLLFVVFLLVQYTHEKICHIELISKKDNKRGRGWCWMCDRRENSIDKIYIYFLIRSKIKSIKCKQNKTFLNGSFISFELLF